MALQLFIICFSVVFFSFLGQSAFDVSLEIRYTYSFLKTLMFLYLWTAEFYLDIIDITKTLNASIIYREKIVYIYVYIHIYMTVHNDFNLPV